jgi:hypothetical protein
MLVRRRLLPFLASSALLAGCLADIPELTRGSTSSTGAGGDATTTTATTAANSTATGWCDSLLEPVDFCADFDGSGGVGHGWDTVDDDDAGAHVERAGDEVKSGPYSAHIWVDEGGSCSNAQLRTTLPEGMSDPPFHLGFQFRPQDRGICAEIGWTRAGHTCTVLVYVTPFGVDLSFRAQPGDLDTTAKFPISDTAFGQWHDLQIWIDRKGQDFAVQYDNEAPRGTLEPDIGPWFAACADPAPEGDIYIAPGSYCASPEPGPLTNAHFDNITFKFEEAL